MFIDDKTCSLDTFKIHLSKYQLREAKGAYLKQARMQHSMIFIEEKNFVIAAGGMDENNGMLNSCEVYSIEGNSWKMFDSLNNQGANLSLCKF